MINQSAFWCVWWAGRWREGRIIGPHPSPCFGSGGCERDSQKSGEQSESAGVLWMGETRPGQARRGEAKAAGERSEMETEGLLPGIPVHAMNCYCCCPLSLMSLVFGRFSSIGSVCQVPGW